jgi:hypothetical protein
MRGASGENAIEPRLDSEIADLLASRLRITLEFSYDPGKVVLSAYRSARNDAHSCIGDVSNDCVIVP